MNLKDDDKHRLSKKKIILIDLVRSWEKVWRDGRNLVG